MANATNLVIVESPSKAKTIGKYLGPQYTVKASMGHLRDLPKSTMGVDIEGGFIPEYLPLENKSEVIEDLRKSAKKAERVGSVSWNSSWRAPSYRRRVTSVTPLLRRVSAT